MIPGCGWPLWLQVVVAFAAWWFFVGFVNGVRHALARRRLQRRRARRGGFLR